MRKYSVCGDWESRSTSQRCGVVAGVAAKIAETADELTRLSANQQRTNSVETITAELLPLCSGMRFIGRHGRRILRTKRYGVRGRPAWLWGVNSIVRRDPYGRVLILGSWNYPLLLPGAQAAQALAAGNMVLLKPAIGCEAVTAAMVQAFHDAGVPPDNLRQLDSSVDSAVAAIDSGVDLIVLTGAASTGRTVLRRTAQSLTPTIMELSGCDAVVVMPDADINRTADAIDFGLNFNGGATCISPRRLIVEDSMAEPLFEALQAKLQSTPAVTVHPTARGPAAEIIETAIVQGAVDRLDHFDAALLRTSGKLKPIVLDQVKPNHEIASADVFAPVTSIIRVQQINQATNIVNECPLRLAASVFGPAAKASELASLLNVGSVAINDLLVPTADPRLPFGGRGESGFGVTRGGEGLLQMTVPKVISRRRGRFAPHLAPRRASDAQTLLGMLQLLHAGSIGKRLQGVRQMVASLRGSS